MIRWRAGVVEAVLDAWPGAGGYAVRLGGDAGSAGDRATGAGGLVRALAYVDLVGVPKVGDRVLLNTTALDQGLGTGGVALVVALPDTLPPDVEGSPAGHIVKARYTPLQTTVLGVDEQRSPHHATLEDADDIGGLPVVVADLHSAVPAIVAGLRASTPDVRVAYLMTDGASLPAAFSRTAATLKAHGWVEATVTVGQAFGGDLEAVTVHSGLLAADRVLGADVAVVAQGPGSLGTGTRWGFSGVSAGEAVNAAATLGGRPVASLRVSGADPRVRHLGISHHSRTAYGRVARAPADLPVPLLGGALGAAVLDQARALADGTDGRLVVREVDCAGLEEALRACPAPLRTMGRGYDEDPAAFLAAAAAGRYAATLLERVGGWAQ